MLIRATTEQVPPYIVMRRGGKDVTVRLQDEVPTPPYVAIRIGGKNRYNPLVDSFSAQRLNSFLLRKDNLNEASSILVPKNIEGYIRDPYDLGNSTLKLDSFVDTNCDGATYFPTSFNYRLKENDEGVNQDDWHIFDPRYWYEPDTQITWSLDVAARILKQDGNKIYILDSTQTELDIDGRYDFDKTASTIELSCFNVGDSILIHHSCGQTGDRLITDPNDIPSDYQDYIGKWEIRKIIAIGESDDSYGYNWYDETGAYQGSSYDYMRILTLDNTPDIDLYHFTPQAVPFIDLATLSICKGLTIQPSSYSLSKCCGGIVAIRCCNTFVRSDLTQAEVLSQYGDNYKDKLPNYGMEFTGGHVVADGSLPFGDAVFLLAKDFITYNEFYTNQAAPYNTPIVYLES